MQPEDTIAEARVGGLLGGKYELQRLVGSGGMGAVYESRNAWTGRRVALKVLHPEFAQKPEVLARFFQEAQAATRIAHPNIVEVLDLGQDPGDGAFYIVQEFLDGTDLRTLMDEAGPMSPRRAVELLAPVMEALVTAHANGVVHRDIKPENIVVTRGPGGALVPKLIDFGVSKMIDRAPSMLSRTIPGTTLGTPYYMSPEQCRGEASVDGRSDVWGVGAVLYEMLAGALAFDAPNYNSLIVKIVTGAPERLETHAPNVPPALADLVHRALTNARDARLASMEVFLAALRRCPLDGPSLPPPLRVAARTDDVAARVTTPMHWADDQSPACAILARPRTVVVPAVAGLGVAGALLLLLATRGGAVHSATAPTARPSVVLSAPVARTPEAPIAAPATVATVVSVARPRAVARLRTATTSRPPAAVTVRAARPAAQGQGVDVAPVVPVARSANGAMILPP